MAIRAPHFALPDLRLDQRPGESPSQHLRDLSELVAHMIELKHDRVCLAAVNTRMPAQILPRASLILSGRSPAVHPDAALLMIAVTRVPQPLALGHTHPAPSEPLTRLAIADVKLLRALRRATSAADLGAGGGRRLRSAFSRAQGLMSEYASGASSTRLKACLRS